LVTITLRSNCRFEVAFDDKEATSALADGGWQLQQTVAASRRPTWPLTIRLHQEKVNVPPKLTIAYHTQEDSRLRAPATHRFHVPWAIAAKESPPIVDNSRLPKLHGGNWLRGQDEFYGSAAGCGKCHSVRGIGAKIGPDLSNLPKRDYASVVRDITHPSFAINPDYVTQTIVTTEGRVLNGSVRTDGDNLIVSNGKGEETVLARSSVEEIEAAELSIMPEGVPKALGPDRMRDLLTFLLVEPPTMPVYGELAPPPPRKRSEVQAVLADAKPAEHNATIHVALVAGPKDHGLGEHDYPAWQNAWRRLLEMDETVQVSTAQPWPSADDLKSADVLVFYQQGAWTPERARDLDDFLRRGGGLVYIHYAVDGGMDPTGFAERIGLAWQGGRSKFRHGPLDVEFVPGSQHPIARNLEHVHFHDESYWNLVKAAKPVNLLATGLEEGQPQPLFWTHEPAIGGRVFVSIPGHYSWTFDDPIFRILLLRGIAWSADEPVDRFNKLVFPGARVTPDDP
jgi:putative heme-binding domain-containing protein